MKGDNEIKDQEIEIDGIDYIICAVCGKKQMQMTQAHLKTHNMTLSEYRDKFPDRLWRAKKLTDRMIENQIKSQYDNEKNKCRRCGKTIAWNKTFCSRQCANKYSSNPLVPVKCRECGELFYRSITSSQIFCSRNCYDSSRNNTSISKRRESIINKYDNKCAICGRFENLRIHHIDTNNKNNEEDNLILLCEKCHRKIHNGTFFTVFKTVTIEVAHFLPGHHHCGQIHGHSIRIDVGVKGSMNLQTGMVIDFGDLKTILKEQIEDKFDHDCLNNYLKIPTAEFLAFYIFRNLKEVGVNVSVVRVYETPNNYLEFKDE